MSFGKARNASYQMADLVQVKKDIKFLYSYNRVLTPTQTSVPFVTGVHPASAPAGYQGLNINGGSMLGRIAFHGMTDVFLTGNNIDVSPISGAYASYVRLHANIGGTCKFIVGAANDGDFLVLEGGSGYMFFDPTGNIALPSNSPNPFVLQGNDLVTFMYDASSLKWVMQSTPRGSTAFVQFGSPDGTNPTTTFQSAVEYPVVIKNSGSYTVDAQNGLGTDYFIKMNDPSFARNVTLPDATLFKGRVITVKHAGSGFNVNVLANAGLGQTIDGAASYVINTLYGSVTVFSDGINWLISSKVT